VASRKKNYRKVVTTDEIDELETVNQIRDKMARGESVPNKIKKIIEEIDRVDLASIMDGPIKAHVRASEVMPKATTGGEGSEDTAAEPYVDAECDITFVDYLEKFIDKINTIIVSTDKYDLMISIEKPLIPIGIYPTEDGRRLYISRLLTQHESLYDIPKEEIL